MHAKLDIFEQEVVELLAMLCDELDVRADRIFVMRCLARNSAKAVCLNQVFAQLDNILLSHFLMIKYCSFGSYKTYTALGAAIILRAVGTLSIAHNVFLVFFIILV